MSVFSARGVSQEVQRAVRIRAAETGETIGQITERALRRELGMMEALTWQVIEDNGGGLHLAVFEGDKAIYYADGYEHNEDGLREDLAALRRGEHPIRDGWETQATDPHAAYEELTSREYGWALVADEDGTYPERMGAAAERVFGVTINVVEVGGDGEAHMERVESFTGALTGTDEEMVEQAIREVEERGYTVVRSEDGGCCEVTRYSDGTVSVGITVEREDAR